MAKHFTLTITDTDFSFARKQEAIDAEASLDGIYVVRTSLPAQTLNDTATKPRPGRTRHSQYQDC